MTLVRLAIRLTVLLQRLAAGATQTWKGRVARIIAFLAGWLYTNAIVAHFDHGDSDRVILVGFIGLVLFLLTFMIGD